MLEHLTEITAVDPATTGRTTDEMLRFVLRWIANALAEEEYEKFVRFIRLKGERYLEAKAHPGEGRAERHTPGERELEGR